MGGSGTVLWWWTVLFSSCRFYLNFSTLDGEMSWIVCGGNKWQAQRTIPHYYGLGESLWPSWLYGIKQNDNVLMERVKHHIFHTSLPWCSHDVLIAPCCAVQTHQHRSPPAWAPLSCTLLQGEEVLWLFPPPYQPCFAFFSSGCQVYQTAV